MITLALSSTNFGVPKESVEYVYSAVETNHSTGESVNLVCYRVANGDTVQAEVKPEGDFVVRHTVGKMKK